MIRNYAPMSYVAPQSLVEERICRLLFKYMLTDKRICIEFDHSLDEANERNEADFVIAPPRLGTVLKLMIAPNLWIGESFIAGSWYLKKGHLNDFLLACRKGARPSYRSYYERTSG